MGAGGVLFGRVEWQGWYAMSREPGEVGLRAEQERLPLVDRDKCTHGDAGYRGVRRTVEFHSLLSFLAREDF